ncbi:MAG: hypothetical protein NT069_17450 [Planctomycetota bacterium]|nr:hypothetical protein [Planctomycetota bacterium]
MICFTDNDLIKKLAFCDLLDDALTALSACHGEIYVLPTARYVLLKPMKNADIARARLGDAVFDRLRSFLDRVTAIPIEPPMEQLSLFEDHVGIDPGEAVLFLACVNTEVCRVATGDKRSLRALHAEPAFFPVCEQLSGRVVCFEQIILRIIDQSGFDAARSKIIPGSNCDTALRAVFGSGLESTEENVRTGLQSYIRDLRRETGSLLSLEFNV